MPVSRRQDHGAVVLSVSAPVNGSLLSKLTAHLRRAPAGQPVIIDLSALTLGNAEMLERLVVFVRSLSGSGVCLVCSRLSARRLLRLAGAADIVPIFMSTADAIQALLFHEDGYGSGWSMGGPTDVAATPALTTVTEDAGAPARY